MQKAYFTISKNSNSSQPYHFVLKAPNHETILNSESYGTKQSALVGINSVKLNSQYRNSFTILMAKNNEPYFILKAGNGEIIGVSETYSSNQMCEHGIDSVMKYAQSAETKETQMVS